jgi:hypothetical protein
MYSDIRNECSHSLGFPIRKSPDHSLLAASRGLSQLTTSFFAYLRQGIHTHALSSLTITSTSYTYTHRRYSILRAFHLCSNPPPTFGGSGHPYNARQYSIVKDLDCLNNRQSFQIEICPFCELLMVLLRSLVGPGGIEPPTSPLSGVRSSHLSYGPMADFCHWWSWSGSNRRPPECKSGALPAELQPLNSEAREPGLA